MDIRLDKNNPIPVSVQVKEQIKMLVNSGTCNAGEKLPSISRLASLLGINKNTIVSILKDLENQGYVESFRGKGVFVSGRKRNNILDNVLLDKIDAAIYEAKKKGMNASELVNLISARFNYAMSGRKINALFLMGISQELVDVNVQKLKQSIPGVEFNGLLFNKALTHENASEVFDRADLFIIPSIVYEHAKSFLPEGKPVIKTMANLKLLGSLKRGVEKKSKVAVIGLTQGGAQTMAGVFVSAGLFKPRLVLSLDEVDKFKKELKEIDSAVICLSAREVVEKLKLKDKDIYFFSDYIDDESINEVKLLMKRIN